MLYTTKEPIPLIQHPLVRALAWSALFHLCILCAFRVKMTYFHTSDNPLSSVAVAIEKELPATTTTLENEQVISQLAIDFNGPDWEEAREKTREKAFRPRLATSYPPTISSYNSPISDKAITFLPKDVSDQSTLYPLRIRLSPTLKKLKVLTDGSSLFKSKESSEMLHQILVSPSRFPIQYSVNINGNNGRIIKWSRESSLTDTVVQSCADMVIERLRFAPFGNQAVEGTITLTFYCNGQELQQLLNPLSFGFLSQ